MMIQFLAQTNSGTNNSVDLFRNGIKNFGYIISTDDTPAAIDWLWQVVMDGSMYSIVCGLGLTVAVFAIGFWCVKFYKTIEEGGLRPALNELVLPVLLVILLSNGGSNMRDMTVGTRDLMNVVNRSVTRAVSAEVNFRNALETIAGYSLVKDLIEIGASNCRSLIDSSQIAQCLELNIIAPQTVKNYFPNANSNGASYFDIAQSDNIKAGRNGQWIMAMEKWTQSALKSRDQAAQPTTTDQMKQAAAQKTDKNGTATSSGATNGGAAPTASNKPADGTNTNNQSSAYTAALNIASVTDITSSKVIRETILSMRGAFIYIIEVMMLVTGLVGPIFVALALFPSGAKFLINWGASFISLGFCKICYSLISGLSALAMVYAGPDSVDMLVASLILGLFAPVLSFGIASGSGIGILNTISYSSSTFGVNLGLSSYNPAAGDGGKNNQIAETPKSTTNSKF
jgi:hypothetical protein